MAVVVWWISVDHYCFIINTIVRITRVTWALKITGHTHFSWREEKRTGNMLLVIRNKRWGACGLHTENSNLIYCSSSLIQVSVSGFGRYHCVKQLSLAWSSLQPLSMHLHVSVLLEPGFQGWINYVNICHLFFTATSVIFKQVLGHLMKEHAKWNLTVGLCTRLLG